ncbi:dihydroorotase [Corynebacterium urealyticum]|uniref:Dihydroorotase n=1 Tax=Corynebacterium urealyticum (strain ATCC 43042 / DSM 7109) TaxID=504474 RepID=B1VDM9_CORU7|nr:dihydroorotase [Corynebacterium urealyticum]QQC41625.1 dihydroorotase [Corynebacterium urealyticum]CAQ04927.1 dihydroorotase [Corynebacterium urealyticum DSM 7109]SNV83549.1 dihydroorotase [Corynebacterium urealyticum]
MVDNKNFPPTGPLAAHPAGAENAVLLKGVLIYGEGEPQDVLLSDGVIAKIGADLSTEAPAEAEVLDLSGQVLLPGLVDMHVHLREPGREDTETIASGSAAAAKGGFTAVFTMANTSPVMDDPAIAESVWYKGQNTNLCDVHPVGSISKGLEGKELTEFGMMADSDAKVRMFSDDGKCVDDPRLMRRAIEYSRGMDVLLAQHCEEPRLTEGAVAHEGETAARLGLRGWPRVAEESIVARDALMARDYGGRIHICHASTEGTVELLRWAKGQDIPLSAEVTPHHLILTDSRLETFDGVNRVNPPLREERDTLALRQALIDGVVDCVATDHAPHSSEEKCCEFDQARPGMLGLETSLAIIADLFVINGDQDWRFVAKVMSERPAEITKLPGHGRPIAEGEPANLCVVDTNASWTAEAKEMASKSENNPYEGMPMPVRVSTTILRGKVTCRNGNPVKTD